MRHFSALGEVSVWVERSQICFCNGGPSAGKLEARGRGFFPALGLKQEYIRELWTVDSGMVSSWSRREQAQPVPKAFSWGRSGNTGSVTIDVPLFLSLAPPMGTASVPQNSLVG